MLSQKQAESEKLKTTRWHLWYGMTDHAHCPFERLN